uniref:N-acetyltransferase domain-containing protein n=1 Tax=Rhabditophanes sp. KR3021 TaxID=114890 RepID=A0AC35U319_9BILA
MTTLRSFACQDLLKFNNVNLDNMTETYGVDYYLNYLSMWPEYCMTAEDFDESIMGYVFGKSEEEGLPFHGHVTALTVCEDYRRLKLGTLFMNSLEQISKNQNCLFVDLFVRASNAPAIQMYHKLGYVQYRRLKDYYSGDRNEDALDMRKSLMKNCEIERVDQEGRKVGGGHKKNK